MHTATSYGYGEDFVMTPIKCPPPKIVAVKRSLKNKTIKIFDDENDSDSFNFKNEEEKGETKDLIEFEPEEEPLIDLSDNNSNSPSNDTIKDMNQKNSSTITMLLDLLEIGSIINSNNNKVCKKEKDDMEDCAQGNDYALLPTSTSKKSSSSSSQSFPLESPSACARVENGNSEKLSSIPSLPQPLTAAIQPENPSIVKNSSKKLVESEESEENLDKKLEESVCEPLHIALAGIDDLSIDLKRIQKLQNETAKNLHQLQKEKEEKSIFASSSANILTTLPSSKDSSHSCSNENLNSTAQNSSSERNKAGENDEHVTLLNCKEEDKNLINSDSNNNYFECNQKLDFLSPHTSQRALPPKFYSSTNSLNRSDCFEASSRLKRLEERFKGFSYTKKLLRSSKLFSKSEEILSSYGKESEFNSGETFNSSLPLSQSTFSENLLRQLNSVRRSSSINRCQEDKKDYDNILSSVKQCSSSSISLNNNSNGEFFFHIHLHSLYYV